MFLGRFFFGLLPLSFYHKVLIFFLCHYKDFKQAKHYYAKIEAVALISRNPMMLNSLKEGLAHLQTSLVVKSLFDRNEKPEIKDTSDIEEEKVDSEIPPVFDDVSEVEGCVTIEEIGESPSGFADDDRVSLDSSSISPLEGPSSLATDTKLAKFKELERRAIWGLAAVMPQLLFVPKIRQKC